MSLAQEIHRIATEYGIPCSRVAEAVKLLGHTDGKLIADYLDQRNRAVLRKVSDGHGGMRRMTQEEFAARFMKK